MKADKEKTKFQNTRGFLFSSVVCLVALCIIVFGVVAVYMTRSSDDTINDLGTLYMSEMSKQLQQKFDAIVNLQITQLEGVIQRTPPETVEYGDAMIEEMAFSGSIRGFNYLALYSKDGEGELLYGESVKPFDEIEFREVLEDEEKNITSGSNASGERILLFSVPAEYPMRGGGKSALLIAGFLSATWRKPW